MAENIGRFKRITLAEAKQRTGLARLDAVFVLEMTEVCSALQEPDTACERERDVGEKFPTAKARIRRFAAAMHVTDMQVAKGQRDGKDTLKVWRAKTGTKGRSTPPRAATASAQEPWAIAVPAATSATYGDNGQGEPGGRQRRHRHG